MTKLSESELLLTRIRTDFKQLQTEKHQLEHRLGTATESQDSSEIRLKEAADRFAHAEESISFLREEADQALASRAELEAKLKEVISGRTELEANLKELQATRSELEPN